MNFSNTKSPAYNAEREAERLSALRTAIWELRRKMFAWRPIADALAITKGRAMNLFYSEVRRRGDSQCEHRWRSSFKKVVTTLICLRCGRVEKMVNGHWTEVRKGKPPIPGEPKCTENL